MATEPRLLTAFQLDQARRFASVSSGEAQAYCRGLTANLLAHIAAQTALLRQAREALGPFATLAATWSIPWPDNQEMTAHALCFDSTDKYLHAFTVGDLRRAADVAAKLGEV